MAVQGNRLDYMAAAGTSKGLAPGREGSEPGSSKAFQCQLHAFKVTSTTALCSTLNIERHKLDLDNQSKVGKLPKDNHGLNLVPDKQLISQVTASLLEAAIDTRAGL